MAFQPYSKADQCGEPREPKGRRGRVNPVSAKRRQAWAEREHVRRAVFTRDGWRCVGPDRGLPGECMSLSWDRPELEVHEMCPRGRDPKSWLDPDRCASLCQWHHDYCTSASGERLEIVRAAGLDVKADPLPALPKFRGDN